MDGVVRERFFLTGNDALLRMSPELDMFEVLPDGTERPARFSRAFHPRTRELSREEFEAMLLEARRERQAGG
jgi:hypothetical protein